MSEETRPEKIVDSFTPVQGMIPVDDEQGEYVRWEDFGRLRSSFKESIGVIRTIAEGYGLRGDSLYEEFLNRWCNELEVESGLWEPEPPEKPKGFERLRAWLKRIFGPKPAGKC